MSSTTSLRRRESDWTKPLSNSRSSALIADMGTACSMRDSVGCDDSADSSSGIWSHATLNARSCRNRVASLQSS
jgi:hypothetical protein